MVLVIYTFVMFYVFFLQKSENNGLKKASWTKFCNILFLFLLKEWSIESIDQQVNIVLPQVFPLKFICNQLYITIVYKSIFFNWNITGTHYLEMLLINMIKLLIWFFRHWSQCSMLLLVICEGFNSRRFSNSNISITLSPYS